MIQLTFAYSGMGDGGQDDPNRNIISFEAALYAYSFEQEGCLFDTPISVTDGASLPDPPTPPFPIAIQPVDTSTITKPRVTLQLPSTATLDAPLFEPNIPCITSSPACRRVSFCLQLQVLVCGVLIDFVDVNAKTEFDIVDCGDGSECLQVRPSGDPITITTPPVDGGADEPSSSPTTESPTTESPTTEDIDDGTASSANTTAVLYSIAFNILNYFLP